MGTFVKRVVVATVAAASSAAFVIATFALVGCGKVWVQINSRSQLIAPSALSYQTSTAIYVYNDVGASLTQPIASDTPSVTGTPTTYSISPDLEANTGLSFNASTGVISGKPTLTSNATTYTITASNSLGETTATVNIRTGPGFLVNDLGDADDSTTSDNECLTSGGVCTLRAAITQINAMSNTLTRLIVIPAYTIDVGSVMTITNNMEIIGAGEGLTVLDGGSGAYDIIDITGGTIGQTITGMTFQNSDAEALYITNDEPVVLNSLDINNVVDKTNQSGAVVAYGTSTNLTLNDSIITNSAGWGGSAEAYEVDCDEGSTCVLNNSVFTQASTTNFGAGVLGAGVSITVSGCEFSDLTSTDGNINDIDAALTIAASYNDTTATVTNSTFTENTTSAGGAAIASVGYNSGQVATVTLDSDTIVGNTTVLNDTSWGNGTGIWVNDYSNTSVVNSIVVDNTNTALAITQNCSTSAGATITSNNYNLTDTTSSDCPFTQSADQLSSTNVDLGTLQDNGGPTPTMALLSGSDAIEKGPPVSGGTCTAVLGTGVTTDERGDARPGDTGKTNCDIGAYETP